MRTHPLLAPALVLALLGCYREAPAPVERPSGAETAADRPAATRAPATGVVGEVQAARETLAESRRKIEAGEGLTPQELDRLAALIEHLERRLAEIESRLEAAEATENR